MAASPCGSLLYVAYEALLFSAAENFVPASVCLFLVLICILTLFFFLSKKLCSLKEEKEQMQKLKAVLEEKEKEIASQVKQLQVKFW